MFTAENREAWCGRDQQVALFKDGHEIARLSIDEAQALVEELQQAIEGAENAS